MIIYHGTSQAFAKQIEKEQRLTGTETNGPLISLTLEEAIKHALISASKHTSEELKPNDKTSGCVIVLENIPSLILNSTSKTESGTESFYLNDEFGKPLNHFNFQKMSIMTIKEAQFFARNTNHEFKS